MQICKSSSHAFDMALKTQLSSLAKISTYWYFQVFLHCHATSMGHNIYFRSDIIISKDSPIYDIKYIRHTTLIFNQQGNKEWGRYMESLDWVRFTRVNRKVCNAKSIITPEALPFPPSFELHYVYIMHHCISVVLRCLGPVIVRSLVVLSYEEGMTCGTGLGQCVPNSPVLKHSFLTVWMDHWTKAVTF